MSGRGVDGALQALRLFADEDAAGELRAADSSRHIRDTLHYLIEEKIDLSVFDNRYHNDANGAPAYDPAILLKIILFAYSRGIIHSRKIEALCRENVVCMALSADTAPHFTTIADFISSSPDEIARIFRNILLVCDEAGLIGREMFAIDGVKLPSNATKEWSGTKADSRRRRRRCSERCST